jgi:acetoacetyl-CoA synthetase
MNDQPLWQPSDEQIAATAVTGFLCAAAPAAGHALDGWQDLWRWSVADPTAFWSLVWDHFGLIGDKGERVLVDGTQMPGARWFPDARLSYAENLLADADADDSDALVFWGEDKARARLSRAELHGAVSRCRQALAKAGVGLGDRVAGALPNRPEAIIAMLATASLGAVWCSASPDFGVSGVLDRFGQIGPKVLFCTDGYWYNGKPIDCSGKNQAIAAGLPGLVRTIVVPYLDPASSVDGLPNGCTWDAFLAPHPAGAIQFTRVPFDHPLFIMFSSGTTGVPKCIVHGTGGSLIQHVKEHRLHCDLRPGDRLFYFTTCGWMMWNWLATGLASRATLLLYDGNPFAGRPEALFDYADAESMTHFGTSAKYLETCIKEGLSPRSSHRLASLRSVLSTGSPLSPDGFRYVYGQIKPDCQLASISGGTDILSCFALGSPILPVYSGELQTRGLGMAVDCFDDEGHPVRGTKGELVCTQPFPSMPVGFWNDADGSRYRAAYFERFPGVWCHGDYVEITAHDGLIIHGRSDATLNPGGVRIGTAEIYRQVETIPEVLESMVVGQDWGSDMRVVLFVRLSDGVTLDAALEERIRRAIRAGATPRHVPARIIAVADIPRTRNGKLVELAVRDVIHGRPIKNRDSLANPEALELFRDLPQLRE